MKQHIVKRGACWYLLESRTDEPREDYIPYISVRGIQQAIAANLYRWNVGYIDVNRFRVIPAPHYCATHKQQSAPKTGLIRRLMLRCGLGA